MKVEGFWVIMTGKGLIIGIDFTDKFCQASYYSLRHSRAESVSAGADVRRYLIPSVLCYDPEIADWAIGDSAVRLSEKAGVLVFKDLLRNLKADTSYIVNNKEYTGIGLLAAYFEKLLEYIQIMTSVMAIENVTVTLRKINRDISNAFRSVFGLLGIPESRVRLLSTAEAFSSFITFEKEEMWKEGALLFDFNSEGFFVEQLCLENHGTGPLIFVNEYNLSYDFSLNNLASEVLRDQLDKKLMRLYQDLTADGGNYSVFFTGEGFNEQWFIQTLNSISDTRRAFKGSNIYVKGACIAGYMESEGIEEKIPVLCPGRTVHDITVNAWDNGRFERILLSPAAVDWYDADYTGDFILENETELVINTVSLINGSVSEVVLPLTGFGCRPAKATRIQLSVMYKNENDCIITAIDKGFGDFFIDGGAEVSTTIQLDSVK